MRTAAAVVLSLVTAPSSLGFSPNTARRPVAFRTTGFQLFGRGGKGPVTGPGGKAASSAEEDLELTYQVIMDHIASEDGDFADDSVDATEEKRKKKKKSPPPAPAGDIDVSKLDIRVGVISKVWEHEEADKLYCEEIDIGEEGGPRQIASGLRPHYAAADLEGRRVCVLANLKARKLVGFKSHGMVLCASTDDGSKVVFVDPPEDAAIGERVMVAGYDGEPATENQILKKKMLDVIFLDLKTNEDGVATYKGTPLTAGSGQCVAQDGLANAQVA